MIFWTVKIQIIVILTGQSRYSPYLWQLACAPGMEGWVKVHSWEEGWALGTFDNRGFRTCLQALYDCNASFDADLPPKKRIQIFEKYDAWELWVRVLPSEGKTPWLTWETFRW